jgi:AraC family transcriptional regulator
MTKTDPQTHPEPPARPAWHDRIEHARRLIEDHLDEDLPLEDLAAAAHYSMFHFHRLFRAHTGETVREHARRLRLERSAYRLTHTRDDILRIALDSGYDSHEAFTRAFKARIGLTPSAFREQRREVQIQRTQEKEIDVDLRIEKREPARIAFVRHTGPYDKVGDAWGKLMKWGWTKMMFGKADTFGLCFDDPDVTPAERTRYEACMVVDVRTKPKGDVELRDLPGGAYAVGLHEGPYERIGDSYAQLFAEVSSHPINGRTWKLGDPPALEKYLNDPRKTKPEELKTEIWMPVS